MDELSECPKPKGSNIVHDSHLFDNILPVELQQTIFQTVQDELKPHWSEMFHKGGLVPRLVCLHGDILLTDDDNKKSMIQPLYRHPADEHPTLKRWTPAVKKLRDIASDIVGQELNHALIQMYRNGDDYISEHADKTLDIERGSDIVNLSIGATRTMILRPKKGDNWEKGKPRPSTRVQMDHASLFVMGWETNKRMTHEIRRDKREEQFKTENERAFDGVRISFTFRKVATFVRDDGTLIGQGAPKAKSKDVSTSASALSSLEEEENLLKAFSNENRQPCYDWDELYGEGFSFINFRCTNQPSNTSPEEVGEKKRVKAKEED